MARYAILLFACLSLKTVYSQDLGLPPFRYYSPQDYNAGNRNWSIISDSTHIIYTANSEGILIFDGVFWDKVELPEKHTAYWIEKDKKGNIYVGANGEFGELKRGSNGRFYYQSLLNKLDPKYNNFNVIWEIAQSGNSIIFRSRKYIFHYDRKRIKAFQVPNGGTGFDVAFSVDDTVYTRIYNLGLAFIDQNGVHTLPQSDFFAQKKVNGIYRYQENQLLIATRTEGLFIYDKDQGVRRFNTSSDEYLQENRIYDGHHLSDGNYALATMANGIVILTPQGKEKFRFDSSNGLGNNQSLFLREVDNQLWLGTKNGIIQMVYNPPYKKVEKEFGLNGQVTSIYRKGNHTYVTCNDGFYQLNHKSSKLKFKPINQHVIVDCITSFEFEGNLYFSSLEGIYKYDGQQTEKLSSHSPRAIIKSKFNGVFIAPDFYFGITILHFENNEIKQVKLSKINRLVTQIIDQGDNVYWARSVDDMLYEIKISLGKENKPSAEISRTISLPKDTHLIQFESGTYLVSQTTLYQLEEQELKPVNDALTFQYKPNKIVYTAPLSNNHCFICYEDELNSFYCEQFKLDDREVISSTNEYIHSSFKPEVIFEDENTKKVWIGSVKGLNIYEPIGTKGIKRSQETLIRRITINNDSIIPYPYSSKIILKHDENNIKLSYTASNSLNSGEVLYQHKLTTQNTWSDWSEEQHTLLSALPPGNYQFQVRSTSPYKGISEITTISFLIKKPWYLTYFAYFIYSLFFISFIYFIYRFRVKSLYKRQNELAKMVTETTGQLAKANAMLNEKADRLEKLGEFKSRFFSNVSHDLRTPIMLLSGRVELLKSDKESYLSQKGEVYVNKLVEDTKKLVLLTDEIKELIKLEEGQISLNLKSISINIFIKRIVNLFESAAESHSITLSFLSEIQDQTRIVADPHYLERIIYNLISNALKFTRQQGQITVSISESKDQLFISVGDDGIGIPSNDLSEIFNRSFQANNQHQINEGLGIGLNVVRELVNLHNGKIRVESKVDEGAKFTLSIPSNKELEADPYEELKVGNYIAEREFSITQPLAINPLIQISASQESNNDLNKLLLVEDNPEVRNYLLELLKKEYKVYVAQHGKEALVILEKYKIDIIVTDLMMPVMDGFEFIAGIKKNPQFENTPVLVVSARDSKEDRYKIMQMGVNNILAKPFDRKEFSLKISNLIAGQNNRHTLYKIVDQVEDHHKEQVSKLNDLILTHISDSQFKVAQMADHFNLSERSFFRMIKNLTGKSPLEYIKDFKFSYALNLLQLKKVHSIKEVTLAIGMKNTSDFNKQFEKRFNVKAQSFLKEGYQV